MNNKLLTTIGLILIAGLVLLFLYGKDFLNFSNSNGENSVELVSVGIPEGGTLTYGIRTEVKVSYVTSKDEASISVKFLDENGKNINTSSSGPAFVSESGEAVFLVGGAPSLADQTFPIEVGFIEIRMLSAEAPFTEYALTKVPYRLSISKAQ